MFLYRLVAASLPIASKWFVAGVMCFVMTRFAYDKFVWSIRRLDM